MPSTTGPTTMWDDAEVLSSRDPAELGAPRILDSFHEPTGGGLASAASTPRIDRNDTMRIRGRVRTTEWAGISAKREDNSASSLRCEPSRHSGPEMVNPRLTIMVDRRP